jgi:regulator of cell morphogenesis and NO signaling
MIETLNDRTAATSTAVPAMKPHISEFSLNRRPIEVHATVNEVLVRHPETIAIFNKVCLDACCGGDLPLESVAMRHALDLTAFLAALENAVRRNREVKAAW